MKVIFVVMKTTYEEVKRIKVRQKEKKSFFYRNPINNVA